MDGKGIYCTLKISTYPTTNKNVAYEFKDGTVGDLFIGIKNDKASILRMWKPQRYSLNDEYIEWNFFYDYYLNRKTLMLEVKDTDNGINEPFLLEQYHCEVFPNHSKLKSKLEKDLLEEQQKYNEKIKDNKI